MTGALEARVAALEAALAVHLEAHRRGRQPKLARRVWTEERCARLKEMRALGKTAFQIGQALGVKEGSVNHQARRLGLPRLQPGRGELSWGETEVRLLTEMVERGTIVRDIAARLGRPFDGVRYKMEALGLKSRATSRAKLEQRRSTETRPVMLPAAELPVSMATTVRQIRVGQE